VEVDLAVDNLCHLSSKVLLQNKWMKKTKGDRTTEVYLEAEEDINGTGSG